MAITGKPPIWFWIVGVILILWGIAGVIGFQVDLATTPAMRAKMSAYDQQLYANRPGWFLWVYGLAVWSGLAGSIVLLARRRLARPIYAVSLVAVVIMFGWMFVATDIIAVKGMAVAAGFPIVIAAIGVVEIWLSSLAIRRSWIG